MKQAGVSQDRRKQLRYDLAGPMVPLPLLYKDDLSVDLDALQRYVGWVLDEGVKNVCFTFTYTQLDFITTDELLELNAAVAEVVGDRGTFVSCTAGGPLKSVIPLVQQMHEAGADTIMVHQPEWVMQNGNTGDVLVNYIEATLKETDAAILCCLLPDMSTTATPLLGIEQFERLVQHDNFVGLKDDFYGIPYRKALIDRFGDRLCIIGGGIMHQHVLFHRYPCQGEFAGMFNPARAVRAFELLDRGNYSEALDMIDAEIAGGWGPPALHWLAACHVMYFAMGLAGSYQMRPPLTSASGEQAAEIVAHVRKHPELYSRVTP